MVNKVKERKRKKKRKREEEKCENSGGRDNKNVRERGGRMTGGTLARGSREAKEKRNDRTREREREREGEWRKLTLTQ